MTTKTRTSNTSEAADASIARIETINAIAAEHLGIKTLEERYVDSLDFHDLSVWLIRDALEAAYEAGRSAK